MTTIGSAHQRFAAVLSVAALSPMLAACGSSSSSNGSASSGLSRSAIDAKANAICADAGNRGKAIHQPASFRDPKVAAAYFDAVEPITAQSTAQLEALKPDTSVSADWGAFIAQRRNGLAFLREVQRKAHAADPTGERDLQRIPVVAQQIQGAAKTVGATNCAQ